MLVKTSYIMIRNAVLAEVGLLVGWNGGRLTGPMSTTGVSSKTFSIGALEESSCGGSNKVTFLAIFAGRNE